MTAWIDMIPDDRASPQLKAALDAARAPSGTVGNVMRVHSHRPSTMLGHVALYKAVLHDNANTVPEWFQETVASYVSLLNHCDYSFTNHWANARHLIGDGARADVMEQALRALRPEQAFDGVELAMLVYAGKLTLTPGAMVEADVQSMRALGADDGQILEINQVCCYFNYVNRLLNGLGVTLQGDIIGYYVDETGAPTPKKPG
jgi:uncharacterized peroxidase-related enzyme